MDANAQRALLQEVALLLRPLVAAAQSEVYRRRLLAAMGWNLDAVPTLEAQLAPRLAAIAGAYQQIARWVETPPETLEELPAALLTVGQAVDAVRTLRQTFAGLGLPTEALDKVVRGLLSYLTVGYLYARHQRLYRLMALLTLIEGAPPLLASSVAAAGGDLLYVPVEREEVRWDRLPALLADPVARLRETYVGSRTLANHVEAQEIADLLFPRLAALLESLGVGAVYGARPAELPSFGSLGDEIAAGTLSLRLKPPLGESGPVFGLALYLSAGDRGGLGLVVVPDAGGVLTRTVGEWELSLDLSAGGPPFAFSARGVLVQADPPLTRVAGRLRLVKLPRADGQAFRLGGQEGTRLEVGTFEAGGAFDLSATAQDYGGDVAATAAALVVTPPADDGFLRRVLPPRACGPRSTWAWAGAAGGASTSGAAPDWRPPSPSASTWPGSCAWTASSCPCRAPGARRPTSPPSAPPWPPRSASPWARSRPPSNASACRAR